MLWNYLTLLKEIQWIDLLDIVIASCLIWFGIHALRTKHTSRVGIGLLLYGLVILTAGQFKLNLTVWILQGITAVVLLMVVVVYQSELRRLLERFPASFLRRTWLKREDSDSLSDLLVNALSELSAAGRGALIVLPGKASLHGIITEGTALDGLLSKSLLLSIFDPNSPGHDGALVISGDRIERFGSRLPLSHRDDQLQEKGTRHAAALGLSERTDALVLVVSEETGKASLAREGRLQTFPKPTALRSEIDAFLETHSMPADRTGWLKNIMLWVGLEGAGALLVASILWLVLVPGAVVQTQTFNIAVEVQNIPEGYALSSVTPATIFVTLSGEKRNLFHINADELVIRLDGTLTSLGRQTYPITSSHLRLPPNVEIAGLAPDQVQVLVRKLR